MPLTNFPGGVSSYGIPLSGAGTVYDMPTGAVWFVSNRTGVINGDGTSRDRPMVSIADALARAGTGDTVFVLADHAENVTASNTFSGTNAAGPNTGAQTIPANCRIIGEGKGTRRPTLTFTAAGSTLALANAGSSIENMILQGPQTGTTTVTTMVTVTAAGCSVVGCRQQLASSATALVTTGISLSSAASDFAVTDSVVDAITGTPTAWVATTGTTGAARVQILRNTARLPMATATTPVIDYTSGSGTAPTNWVIADNCLSNLTAASTVVIKGVASSTGHIVFNYLETVGGTAAAVAITTPGSMVMFQNFVAQGGKQAIAITTGGNSS